MSSYEVSQIDRVSNDGQVRVKFTSDHHETKWLDISPDMLNEIRNLFSALQGKRMTTEELLTTVRERWPNALRTEDPVVRGGNWAGAVLVWAQPILPMSDGRFMMPNYGVSDTNVVYATLESAEKRARHAFDDGDIYA